MIRFLIFIIIVILGIFTLALCKSAQLSDDEIRKETEENFNNDVDDN